jgi:SAM-dependent methyltransferase
MSDSTPNDVTATATACVDLRSAGEYALDRPAGAVRLDVEDLLYKPYLLPPRHRALVLVGGPADRMPLVVRALLAAGHPLVRHFADPAWRQHLQAESGVPTRRHLWEPSEALVEALALQGFRPGSTAIDIACGTGRNAVWLAMQGLDVWACDILADALERAQDRAAKAGVTIRTRQMDVEFPGALDDLHSDLVVVVRFLDRALFGPLQRVVNPGGLLVYETFTTDQAELGHPRNPKHLLQPGELAAAFPDLQTLIYREGFFDGAHLARLVARAAEA